MALSPANLAWKEHGFSLHSSGSLHGRDRQRRSCFISSDDLASVFKEGHICCLTSLAAIRTVVPMFAVFLLKWGHHDIISYSLIIVKGEHEKTFLVHPKDLMMSFDSFFTD